MLTKIVILLAVLLPLAGSSLVVADEVIAKSTDNTHGKTLGFLLASLLGGAAGEPVGAIVGGLSGAWAGGEIHEASDASGNTYEIRKTSAEHVHLRSPKHELAIDDEVIIEGIRPLSLATLTSSGETYAL